MKLSHILSITLLASTANAGGGWAWSPWKYARGSMPKSSETSSATAYPTSQPSKHKTFSIKPKPAKPSKTTTTTTAGQEPETKPAPTHTSTIKVYATVSEHPEKCATCAGSSPSKEEPSPTAVATSSQAAPEQSSHEETTQPEDTPTSSAPTQSGPDSTLHLTITSHLTKTVTVPATQTEQPVEETSEPSKVPQPGPDVERGSSGGGN